MSSVEERFWGKVDKRGPDDCWEWGACGNSNGYGLLKVDGRMALVHRFSWTLAYGPIPEGLCVLHKCDNRACCNPAHLFLGTHRDNMRDRDRKGRNNALAGERHGMARLTKEQVLEIRRNYKKGDVSRRELAAKHGVSPSHISDIVSERYWKHL